MSKLVLIRHGQSLWNLENRFTGWVDVPLTAQGESEAKNAATHLKGLNFQVAYTSALSRAQRTCSLVLEALGQTEQVPVVRDSALNERHYGDLQGLNKEETARRFGAEQVALWRRSYDIAPPGGESLKMTAARVIPFYDRCILGDLKQGKNVLVVAHGNSLRALHMILKSLTPEQVVALELATGAPSIYEFTTSFEKPNCLL
jgi:2,3-bisphosphoglycerate-dependent phosphoglycerate mutase